MKCKALNVKREVCMKIKKPIKKVLPVFLLLSVSLSTVQFGQIKPLYSYYNMFFGARSISMGNAFTAVADDLTTVFRNPAGVAEFKGPRLYLNVRWDKNRYDYQPQEYTSGMYNQQYTYDFNSTLKNIDFFSISAPVFLWGVKWNFALSYYRYIPYGFNGTSQGILTTGSDTAGETAALSLAGGGGIDTMGLTSAFELTDYLSFGITLQQFFNSGSIDYELTSTAQSFRRESTEKIKGRNIILGLLFELHRNIVFGISYQFKFSGTLDAEYTSRPGDENTETATYSTEAGLVIPSQISLGLLLRPFKFMQLSFDYSKINWSKGAVSNYYDYEDELEYPVRDDFSFLQQDAVNYRLGVEFNFPIKKVDVFIRGGWFSDGQLFVDAASEAVKIKGFSLGLGVDISSRVRLDAAYMHRKATWDEPGYFDPQNATVSTDYSNKIFSLSMTIAFGKKT